MKFEKLLIIGALIALATIGFIWYNYPQHPKYLTNDIRYPTYCNENEEGCTKEICENSGGEWRTLMCDPTSCPENANELCSCTGKDNSKPNCFWNPNFGCDCRYETMS